MISHPYECIFIHQRKCAGSSIINAFDFTVADPDWHFMNDGVVSPEYSSAPPGYFYFSIVRNPWDRFISGWKNLTATRERSLLDVLTNMPSEGADYRHLTRPQYEILCDENGRPIIDYLMRFETLQHDFDQVCDIIGKPRRVLAHNNQGVRKHYTDYFDDEARRIFLQHFALDVELFGYEYEEGHRGERAVQSLREYTR